MKRKLERDISLSEMLTLRESGMTNHQIAQAIGCGESTVYKYIGRRSQAVKHAEIQGKPCPVRQVESIIPTPAPAFVPIPAAEESESKKALGFGRAVALGFEEGLKNAIILAPALPILRESHVYDLQGSLCVFHVDTASNAVEMRDEGSSMITGILDVADIPAFIKELEQVAALIASRKG